MFVKPLEIFLTQSDIFILIIRGRVEKRGTESSRTLATTMPQHSDKRTPFGPNLVRSRVPNPDPCAPTMSMAGKLVSIHKQKS